MMKILKKSMKVLLLLQVLLLVNQVEISAKVIKQNNAGLNSLCLFKNNNFVKKQLILTEVSRVRKRESVKKVFFDNEMNRVFVKSNDNTGYNITYDTNGGSGRAPIDSYNYIKDSSATVLDFDKLFREGYVFDGWSLDKDGKTDLYTENETIIIKKDITLYAMWQKKDKLNYMVLYDANNPTAGSVKNDIHTYPSGTKITIEKENDLVKAGHEFIAWNTKKDGTGKDYKVKSKIILDSNKILYAKWSSKTNPNNVEIIFDKNADDAIDGDTKKQSIKKETTLLSVNKKLGNPTREGYKLAGWCTTKSVCMVTTKKIVSIVGVEVNRRTKLIDDTIAYAQWTRLSDIPKTGQDIKPIFIPIIVLIGGVIAYIFTKDKNDY